MHEVAGAESMAQTHTESQLLETIRALVSEHGKLAAAERLGINFRTLKSALESGQLSRHVCEAVERYLAESEPPDIEPSESEAAVCACEQQLKVLTQQVESLSDDLAALRRSVSTLQSRPPEPIAPARAPEHQRRPVAASAPVKQTSATSVVSAEAELDESWPEPLHQLIEEWRESKVDRATSRHTLAWLRAERRTLELELLLAGEQRLSLPPAEGPWSNARRRRELRLRESALQTTRVRLFWTRPLHWLMRSLTLGLWGR